MDKEIVFRMFTAAVLLLGLLLRFYFVRKADKRKGAATIRESRRSMFLQAVFYFGGMLLLIAYIGFPRTIQWAALPMPVWIRWMGVSLGGVSLGFLVWVHRSLSMNCSFALSIREEHTLVTKGPYKRIRHPMYAVWYLLHLAFFMMSSNGLIGVYVIGFYVIPITLRMREEEDMLTEKFGDAYLDYKKRTGRIFPRPFRLLKRIR